MRVQMQEGSSASDLQFSFWQLALIGTPVDDRGLAAVRFANESADESRTVSYSSDLFSISVGNVTRNAEELDEAISTEAGKSILLEATTLGFVEIFLALK